MKRDKWTRMRETEQALAVGTKVERMTKPAAKIDTMFERRA